jgi:hypothetical protein
VTQTVTHWHHYYSAEELQMCFQRLDSVILTFAMAPRFGRSCSLAGYTCRGISIGQPTFS